MMALVRRDESKEIIGHYIGRDLHDVISHCADYNMHAVVDALRAMGKPKLGANELPDGCVLLVG